MWFRAIFESDDEAVYEADGWEEALRDAIGEQTADTGNLVTLELRDRE